jgi:hypothetical protein
MFTIDPDDDFIEAVVLATSEELGLMSHALYCSESCAIDVAAALDRLSTRLKVCLELAPRMRLPNDQDEGTEDQAPPESVPRTRRARAA